MPKKNKKKQNKIIWTILLIIGLLPFFLTLVYAFYISIVGSSGICIMNCTKSYGPQPFFGTIMLLVFAYSYIYALGLIFTILSIYKLER